ncbi:MAG TPA: hypothetical protein VF412_10860 [Bdellovibrio sp.]|uniref:hypothetical protein n=1 Tax=Bdellovibrio sp. TaxID=28201 RepID=UPI002EF5DFF4
MIQAGHCPSRNCGSTQAYTYSGSTDEADATAKFTTNFTRAPGVNYLLTLTNKQEPQKNFSVAFHQYEDQSIGVSSVGIGGAVVNTAGLQCVEQ